MGKCKICDKSLAFYQGFKESNGDEYCRECYPKKDDKIFRVKKNKRTKSSRKEVEKTVSRDELLSNAFSKGCTSGVIFAALMFALDSLVFNKVYELEVYVFYGIFFGFIMGIFNWYSMNKRENEKS